ncbi:uncharacterized protein HMPREF1541_09351 [Cyphellophora europaea CBS 101466]|uniref:GED domain-containing protein n=1 Tax=Cyphellophora europaea (strain CBS 101466) TaxID=1220924 RepID=W2SC75_CYPE1|nr:uncharacterized protein HMPREF1541_09351 [Cyphellophora europaea CBS 101466]ETN45519.1 hypothetical protein HMPREF1541_09351 [Cyphellophora europaea CBS 101466]
METSASDQPIKTAPQQQDAGCTSIRDERSLELLDTIDGLRALGINNEIPLPQIIVVGEQSAGKSSVLEAISGIRFPANQGRSTRFATEVILRHARSESTDVRIKLHDELEGSPQRHQRLDMFERQVQEMTEEGPLRLEQIPDIMRKATTAMNLDDNESYSRDILQIEVKGPAQDHLTLIDLPGIIFHSRDDVSAPDLVEDMVKEYVRNERSIILSVITTLRDYNSQAILKLLKNVAGGSQSDTDKATARAIGVITHADQLPRTGPRHTEYLELFESSRESDLGLGWHALRNPGLEERAIEGFDRDSHETELFRKDPSWIRVSDTDKGAASLRSKLSRLLTNHVSKELQHVVACLDEKLAECETELDRLGRPRFSHSDNLEYLSAIGQEYYKRMEATLKTPLKNDFSAQKGLPLAGEVRSRCDSFAAGFSATGMRWLWSANETDAAAQSAVIGRSSATQDSPLKITADAYIEKVATLWEEHRGWQMPGTLDPAMLEVLFHDQTSRWADLATRFVDDVYGLVHDHVCQTVATLTNQHRSELLIGLKFEPELRKRKAALDKRLVMLLRPHTSRRPMTWDARLSQLILADELQIAKDELPHGELDSTGMAHALKRYACKRLGLHVYAHYQIAEPAFLDNLFLLGIEDCLMQGLAEIMSPSTLISESEQTVQALAAEFSWDAERRDRLLKRRDKLEAGRRLCKSYKPTSEPSRVSDQPLEGKTEPGSISSPTIPRFRRPHSPPQPEPSTESKSPPETPSFTWSSISARSSNLPASTAQTSPSPSPQKAKALGPPHAIDPFTSGTESRPN